VRHLITRGRLRAGGVALMGTALLGLVVLTALQPVPENGSPRVDAFAVTRDPASASATATPPASPTIAPSPSSTFTSTAASTFTATAVVPSPLPVLIVRIPPQAPTPTPAPAVRTPAPAPASTGTSSSGGDIEAIITAAAQAEGVAPVWLISTAACESGLNPNAYNGSGPYEGLFQFLPSTFRAHGGTDIWDPSQQAQIAATMFANGESGEWPVCSR
jgi:soluble lytic murein transglycosylase-like protein